MAELVLTANIAAAFQLVTGRVWKVGLFFFVAEKLSDEASSRDALLAELRAAPNSQTWLTIT
jgi:hypothetical protein